MDFGKINWGKNVITHNTGNRLRMVNGMYSMNTKRGINMRMIGMQQVEANFKTVQSKMYYAPLSALLKIGIYIREDMDKTPPLVPVSKKKKDKNGKGGGGRLRAAFQIIPKKNADPSKNAVELGWPAGEDEYAAYVHEMTQPPYENPIDWSRPGSGPKFFEMAIKRNQKVMVDIVKAEIRKELGL